MNTEQINLDTLDLAVETPVPENTATQKQIDLINRLKAEREIDPKVLGDMRAEWGRGEFTKESASAWIDLLFKAPKKERAQAEFVPVPEGMHKFGGVIFKVQRAVHGSGHPYAKALLEDGSESGWGFEYVAGAIRNLSEDTLLTLDEAKEFGRVTGTCVYCARTLTDERSIEVGCGKTCASNNGIPWG